MPSCNPQQTTTLVFSQHFVSFRAAPTRYDWAQNPTPAALYCLFSGFKLVQIKPLIIDNIHF